MLLEKKAGSNEFAPEPNLSSRGEGKTRTFSESTGIRGKAVLDKRGAGEMGAFPIWARRTKVTGIFTSYSEKKKGGTQVAYQKCGRGGRTTKRKA